MPSKAERVALTVETLLKGGSLGGELVYRDRQDAFTREEPQAWLLELLDEDTSTQGGPVGLGAGPHIATAMELDTLRFAVTTVIRGANWQARADALRVESHRLVMQSTALWQLVAHIRRDRCEWQPQKSDQPFGYVAQIYVARYLTRSNALDAA